MYLTESPGIYSATPIRNTADAGKLLCKEFADADREYLIAVYLDACGRPISYHIAGIGHVSAVHFCFASVFKMALLQNAVSLIVCHNHPGGSLTPSEEDLKATKEIVEIGAVLGIRVLDHFIITPEDYLSLREERGDLFE